MNDDEIQSTFEDMFRRASPEAKKRVIELLKNVSELPPEKQMERGREAARILKDDLGRQANEN